MSASREKPSTSSSFLVPALAPLSVALCLVALPDTWWRGALVLLVAFVGALVTGVALRAQRTAARAAQRDQEVLDDLDPLPRTRPDAR